MTPEILNSDLKDILSTAHGKRFILTILQQCGIFNTSFGGDPLATAYSEGRRAIGLELVSRIKAADFAAFLKILALEQENTSE